MTTRVHWNDEDISALIHELLEQKRVGNWAGTGPNSAGLKSISKSLSTNNGISKLPKQIKNKYENLKAEFSCWTKLKNNETGLGFDVLTGTIQASDEWWDRKVREDPLAKKFRHRPPLLEELQNELFVNSIATGNSQWTPSSNSFLESQRRTACPDLNVEQSAEVDYPMWDNNVVHDVEDEESVSPPKSTPQRPGKSTSRLSGEKRKQMEGSSRGPSYEEVKDMMRARSVVVESAGVMDAELDVVFQILNELFADDPENPLYDKAVDLLLSDVMKRKGFIRYPPSRRMKWIKDHVK